MTYAVRGKGDDITITPADNLKNEVHVLRVKCDMLEKAVRDLQSICATHERTLETFRLHIVDFHMRQRTLDSNYEGEEFELMP